MSGGRERRPWPERRDIQPMSIADSVDAGRALATSINEDLQISPWSVYNALQA